MRSTCSPQCIQMFLIFLMCFIGFSSVLFADETIHLPAVLVNEQTEAAANSIITIEGSNQARFASIDEVLREVPGLSVLSAGGPGQQTAIFIRGANAEHTLVLLDGIEINDASNPSGAFDFSSWDLNSIERIEIYRGPSSLRFGSGALGGVINIITRKPQKTGSAVAAFKVGSLGTSDASVELAKSVAGFRMQGSLHHFESAGISAASEASGATEKDGTRLRSGMFKVGTEINPQLDVEFLLRSSRSHTDLDFAESNAAPFFVSVDDPNSQVESRHDLGALLLRHKWNEKINSNWTLSRSWMTRDYENTPDENNSSQSSNQYRAQTTKFENITHLLVSTEWHANVGFQMQKTEASSIFVSPVFQSELQPQQATIWGSFLEGIYQQNEISTSVGLRQDVHAKFGPSTTWSVAPNYHFISSESWLGLQVSTAFKSPSLYQLYAPQIGQQDLRPERGQGIEINWKKAFAEHMIFTSSFFENHFQDLIQFGTRYENTGRARIRGVEFGLQGSTRLLKFDSTVMWIDPVNLETGATLLRRPRQSWNLSVERKFNDAVSGILTARGVSGHADLDAVTSLPVQTSGFEILNLSVNQAHRDSLSWTFSVENLLDRSSEEVAGYGRPGRSFLLSLSLKK